MNSKKLNTLYQHFAIVILFFAPLIILPKGFLETKFNLFEYPELFQIFKCITFCGDGWMLLAVLIFILARLHYYTKRKNLKELYNFLLAALIMIILVSVLKNIVFEEALRPIAYLDIKDQHWNPAQFDIHFNRIHSFPSGHTATFATIVFFLMRFFRKKIYNYLLFGSILLVGFSRMFLFQHFVLDVFIGMYIGLFSVSAANQLTSYFLSKKKNTKAVLAFNN